MAAEIARAEDPRSPAKLPAVHPFIQFLVKRRVSISIVLFSIFVPLDLFVFHSQLRDVLNLADGFVIASYVLIVAGLILRSWAAGTLRKRESLAVTGPYAMIRHPLYVGSFLMLLGFGTLVNFPLTFWMVFVPLAGIYWIAIRVEERQIARLFPYEWPAYAASVPRFVPRKLVYPSDSTWSIGQWYRNAENQAWIGAAIVVIGIKTAEILVGG